MAKPTLSRSPSPAPQAAIAQRVESVRAFNRFYTRRIGLLHEGRLYPPFSLTEARVLYELAHPVAGATAAPSAADLSRDLELDAGYLSRLLNKFARQGLVRRSTSADDGRRSLVTLTPRGRSAFARLNAISLKHVGALLGALTSQEQERVVRAMDGIAGLLSPLRSQATGDPATRNSVTRAPGYVLRPHRPGDMGWVIAAHGRLYAQEYGWDDTFEALVAEIAAKFIRAFDAKRERCWIAELDGEPVGSVFLVKQSVTVGKLRLLILDPKARGLGIGKRLVEECIAFARLAGYRKLSLWTNSVLTAARAIYVQTGFTRVSAEPHHSFGKDLVGEEWELKL
jgi:DNA-binding MarR family transcriptional regulator/GNAT superfamily N-acetyltransferase